MHRIGRANSSQRSQHLPPGMPGALRRTPAGALRAVLGSLLLVLVSDTARGAAAERDELISPIRAKLQQLEALAVKDEADLRAAVVANSLAGNIAAALQALREIFARFPRSVTKDDMYKGALFSKSVGDEEASVEFLLQYLDTVGWRSVTSTSFLGTLYFELGRYRLAEGAFTLSVRLGAASPPIHTMSMLVATCLQLGALGGTSYAARARAVYAALLGHPVSSRNNNVGHPVSAGGAAGGGGGGGVEGERER